MSSLDSLTEYAATLEALVFASDKPVLDRELQHHLPDHIEVVDVMAAVMQRYDATSGLELCRVGDGWAFRTRPAVADRLQQHKTVERPLSRAALEVLAIIAYHQPITRAEIEEIRGIIHVIGIYCGVPQALECFRVARKVLEEHDML